MNPEGSEKVAPGCGSAQHFGSFLAGGLAQFVHVASHIDQCPVRHSLEIVKDGFYNSHGRSIREREMNVKEDQAVALRRSALP